MPLLNESLKIHVMLGPVIIGFLAQLFVQGLSRKGNMGTRTT